MGLKYSYLFIGLIVASIIFYIFFYDYFFGTKIDFNTTEFDNYDLNTEITLYKSLSENLIDTKMIRTLFYGRIILENTSTDLLTKIILPNDIKITKEMVEKAKKVLKKYRNFSFVGSPPDVMICYSMLFSFKCERVGDKTKIGVGSLFEELCVKNKELCQEIAQKCSSMFTEDCFKELIEKNMISNYNKNFSTIDMNTMRFGMLILFIDAAEYRNDNTSFFVAFLILSFVYLLIFYKIGFETEEYAGTKIKPQIELVKNHSESLTDDKTARCLYYSFVAIQNTASSRLSKLKLSNGTTISKEKCDNFLKDLKQLGSGSSPANDFNSKLLQYFYSYEVENKENKVIFKLSSKEKKFINDNDSEINEIGKASSVFSSDCLKYLVEKNANISESETVSFIGIAAARFGQMMS